MPHTEGSITSVMFILGTEYLLYGVYAVLFIFSLVVLRHRKAKKLPNNGIHFLSMIILFLITTLTTIMHSIEIAYSVSKLDSSSQPLGSDSDKATRHPSAELWRALIGSVIALSFTANFISDILIIYRMYLIWGKRKKVVTIPFLASCCNHAFAIYATAATVPKVDNIPESSNQTNLFKLIIFGVNVAINLVVTLLNAGKIYMITRHASEILNTSVKRTYYNALAIILESGIIYVLAHIVLLVSIALFPDPPVTTMPIIVPVVASVPTLIIVRAGLGLTVENVQEVATTFEAHESVD